MASHSSVLAWRIPGMGEPGGLPSMGSHRVGHDWSHLAAAAALPLVVIFHFLRLCFWWPWPFWEVLVSILYSIPQFEFSNVFLWLKLGFCVLGRKTREVPFSSHISRDILIICKISAVSILLSLFSSLILVVISLIFFNHSFYKDFLKVFFFFVFSRNWLWGFPLL